MEIDTFLLYTKTDQSSLNTCKVEIKLYQTTLAEAIAAGMFEHSLLTTLELKLAKNAALAYKSTYVHRYAVWDFLKVHFFSNVEEATEYSYSLQVKKYEDGSNPFFVGFVIDMITGENYGSSKFVTF